MKKWAIVLVVMAIMGFSFGTVNASNSAGPAPNSGDGIPDGSGFDGPAGPFGPGSE